MAIARGGARGEPGRLQHLPRLRHRGREDGDVHAPPDVDWTECADVDVDVFPDGDNSLPPMFSVLPTSERAVVVHRDGLADFVLISESQGTRIALHNMTWNGQHGFQTPIANDSFIVDGMGALGTAHHKRGLAHSRSRSARTFFPVAAYDKFLGFRRKAMFTIQEGATRRREGL
ncbi:hypothetical protein FOMPIDRAFT_1055228 [Fomitopsis schrenkii]|uniref:Uncharacterized protein n=1 Tax=Fomitopsis schrenkii TaxID=2126942 RepID=S8EXL2_FOMSC|nr:hypothetical protein FOMPIDRAFT_1055228 [Fomitopsis schrenkii]